MLRARAHAHSSKLVPGRFGGIFVATKPTGGASPALPVPPPQLGRLAPRWGEATDEHVVTITDKTSFMEQRQCTRWGEATDAARMADTYVQGQTALIGCGPDVTRFPQVPDTHEPPRSIESTTKALENLKKRENEG